MKRFLLGAGWFAVLWFGTLMVGGMVVGGMAGAGLADAAEAARAGHAAGAEFGMRYGGVIFAGSAAVALFGTLTGLLPGTGRSEA